MSILIFFQLSYLLLIIIAPVPAAFYIINRVQKSGNFQKLSDMILLLVFFWITIQTMIGIILGVAGIFNSFSFAITEIGLILLGIPLKKYINLPIKQIAVWEREEKIILLCFGFLFIMLFWKITAYPITNFDSLNYHLPAILAWYHSGSILQKLNLYIGSYYPYNWEMLCALFIFPFKNDALTSLPNLLPLLICALSVYCLAGRMKISRIYSLGASLILCSVPAILYTIPTNHIDLAFASILLAGLYFLFVFSETKVSDVCRFIIFIYRHTRWNKSHRHNVWSDIGCLFFYNFYTWIN